MRMTRDPLSTLFFEFESSLSNFVFESSQLTSLVELQIFFKSGSSRVDCWHFPNYGNPNIFEISIIFQVIGVHMRTFLVYSFCLDAHAHFFFTNSHGTFLENIRVATRDFPFRIRVESASSSRNSNFNARLASDGSLGMTRNFVWGLARSLVTNI